jgi:uncharacterized protein (TIGR00369 family)
MVNAETTNYDRGNVDAFTDEADILDELRSAVPASALGSMQIPPPIFNLMEGRIESYTPGQSLTTSFPVKEDYYNPLGRMQGGMIATAIDNTYGPLSFLVGGGAAVTLSMNLDYVRGITAGRRLTVTASVISRSRTNLILGAEATDHRGKLVARSTAQFQILRMPAGKGA